jgi:cytochrome c-type biogenesis protein CcmH
MMWFWILATTLVVVVLGVLLRPLLRPAPLVADNTAASNLRLLREQVAELDAELAAGRLDATQHAAARAELERRVLDETRVADTPVRARGGRWSALVLAVAVPGLAVLLYGQLGNRAAMDSLLAQAPTQATAEDVDALVQRLADRMQAQPEDPAGWLLLARAYGGLQRFPEASAAYAQALKRQAPDAQLLADYADVLAMTQGRTLIGEPEKLVLQALALEPDHLKALALAGTAAMERGDPQAALKHWNRAKAVAPAGSPFATGLDPAIADARAAAGLPAAAPETPTAQAPAPAAAPLQVTVRLAPALAAQLQPGDTLFVFARAADGPRMPLAIVRQPAGAGPVQVQLDDSSAMTPQLKLSGFAQVVVGARISRSGNATPQTGDLEGQTAARPSSGNAEVLIDRVRD